MTPLAAPRAPAGKVAGIATEQCPFISVIVPVRNEAGFIADTLERLFGQDYPAGRFEVLVADGQSTDETRTIVTALRDRFPNLCLLDNPRRWSSAGRNVAIGTARGDLVLLVDGHWQQAEPSLGK